MTGTVPSGTTGTLTNTATLTAPPRVNDRGGCDPCEAINENPAAPPPIPGLPDTGAPLGGSGPGASGPMTLALLLLDALGVVGLVGAAIVRRRRLRRRHGD